MVAFSCVMCYIGVVGQPFQGVRKMAVSKDDGIDVSAIRSALVRENQKLIRQLAMVKQTRGFIEAMEAAVAAAK